MARFHAYRLSSLGQIVVDLQSEVVDSLTTRAVAPLVRLHELPLQIHRLNPRFQINDEIYVLATQFLASIPVSSIGAEVVDLTNRQDDIVAAVDFLFQGF